MIAHDRQRFGVVLVAVCIALASHALVAAQTAAQTEVPSANRGQTPNWLINPENWIDHRYAFEAGQAEGNHEALRVDDGGWRMDEAAWDTFPARGVWESGVTRVPGGFTELLPSWNVEAPPMTGLTLQVRVAHEGPEGLEWSPAMYIGEWGEPTWDTSPTEFEKGRVAVDILKLDDPAAAFELRVVFESRAMVRRTTPRLRRVVAVASHRDESRDAPASPSNPGVGERILLPVPHMVEGEIPDSVITELCSPWSTGMVMAWAGAELPIARHAQNIFDPTYGIFGNWGRAVAWASSHGLRAEVARFRSWSDVRATLERGQPIIVSIAFEAGQFPSNILESTTGHLIVIRGMTEAGHAIVNDPARRRGGEAVVYEKHDLARAWFSRGGVSYLIEPAEGRSSDAR